MKSIIKRTKVSIYILLAILTAVFACVSFQLYSYDIELRLNPQVERAIVQASRLLPQLEENEDVLREISLDLENSRQRILRTGKGLPEDRTGNEGEMWKPSSARRYPG